MISSIQTLAVLACLACATMASPMQAVGNTTVDVRHPTFKPGHDSIKEFHFHVYWMTQSEEQSKKSQAFTSVPLTCAKNTPDLKKIV